MQLMNAAAGSDLTYDVRRYGSFLSTRATGDKLRQELEGEVRANALASVSVDFTGVQAVTISFADEFIGRLMAARAAGDLGESTIIIIGLNDETEEALSICLERRNALALADDDRGARLLAGERHEVETLEVVLAKGSSSATAVAAELGITPQNVNNRLKRLADYGVIRRTREAPTTGGREYVYSAAVDVRLTADPQAGRPRVRAGKTAKRPSANPGAARR